MFDAGEVEAAHIESGAEGDICGQTGGRNLGAHKRTAHKGASTGRPSRARKDSQPDPGKKPAAAGAKKPASLYDELLTTYQLMFGVWGLKDPYCAGIALDAAPGMARAWDEAQQANPAVRK